MTLCRYAADVVGAATAAAAANDGATAAVALIGVNLYDLIENCLPSF